MVRVSELATTTSLPAGAAGTSGLEVRRELRPGDLGAIAAMHGRIYRPEHGVNVEFEGHVAQSLGRAAAAGFPRSGESIRLLEDAAGTLRGSVALTDEGGGVGCLRWVLLDPAVRGRGLGRRMIAATVEGARAAGYERVVLETFSDLRVAAAIYRSLGFELRGEDHSPRWGRERVTYQRYELIL
jgi:GNAT superfamily N-acetyltransferase